MDSWKHRYASKLVSPEEAATRVRNGDRIYLGSMCSEPVTIIKALEDSTVEDVEMIQFISGHEASSLATKAPGRFSIKTFFVARPISESEPLPEADYVPLFHSQIPHFFRNRRIPVDVAIVQVSEPDRFGRFSLGVSVDITLAAVESARIVIAQVNPWMPRTHGDTFIPVDKINYLVYAPEPLCELPAEILGEREKTISGYCSELIENGSVLQFGFAGLSKGLMDFLKDHKNLGLHTEIFADPLIDLIESGVVNNSSKKTFRGKSLATCCMGTRRLYDYVNDNSLVEFYPSDMLLAPSAIASNDRMVAVNLAVQVDLRGQIKQGSPAWTAFEGSGGDQDFMMAASLSKGGRSIVCLRSTAPRSGRSNIVPAFGPKSAVIMNRGEVNYIITEYGIAYLGGQSIRDRVLALVEIAHPDHRDDLMKQAREMGYVHPSQVYYRGFSPEFRRRIRTNRIFKGGIHAHIRLVKASDESMMRDLFYNLSESSVYFRYFSPRKSMPHDNLQKYVNLREEEGCSLVATIGPPEHRRIIAEARYMFEPGYEFPDVAFMVDEHFQRRGLASSLLHYLIDIGKERNVKGFKADVLFSNKPMLRIFEKLPYVMRKTVADGVVTIHFNFDELKGASV
jgi:acyl-CoA hydrolase/GNAT superfamily N-acetyltransferase